MVLGVPTTERPRLRPSSSTRRKFATSSIVATDVASVNQRQRLASVMMDFTEMNARKKDASKDAVEEELATTTESASARRATQESFVARDRVRTTATGVATVSTAPASVGPVGKASGATAAHVLAIVTPWACAKLEFALV